MYFIFRWLWKKYLGLWVIFWLVGVFVDVKVVLRDAHRRVWGCMCGCVSVLHTHCSWSSLLAMFKPHFLKRLTNTISAISTPQPWSACYYLFKCALGSVPLLVYYYSILLLLSDDLYMWVKQSILLQLLTGLFLFKGALFLMPVFNATVEINDINIHFCFIFSVFSVFFLFNISWVIIVYLIHF